MASAVMESPQLIIADEPTPGLDAQAAGRLLGHFRELAQEGAAVLFITHDLELALTVAHRVAVFYAGETIEEALASDFEAGSLRHPFTQALWDALPQRGFRPIPGSQPYPGEVGEGCPFLGQCPHPGADCAQGPLPLRPFQGGAVRCLYPNKEVAAVILQAKDLRFSYSKKGAPVLEDVSLSLHSGERLGLWAPSGRGKTTLCRLLAGYERPQKGEVLLDGKPLSAYAGPCPVQMVWQHPENGGGPSAALGQDLGGIRHAGAAPAGCPPHPGGLAHPLPRGAFRRRAPAVLPGPRPPSRGEVPPLR